MNFNEYKSAEYWQRERMNPSEIQINKKDAVVFSVGFVGLMMVFVLGCWVG